MKPLFLVCCAVLLALGARAQFYVRGVVVDSAGNLGMAKVSIENRNTAKGVFSSATGEFVILAKEGDYLIFSSVGFKEAGMQVKAVHRNETVRIVLKPRSVQLKDVTITKGYTPYQLDSIKRASLYKDAFKYKQQKSIMSPISAVQQKFSKKHKNMRKFQAQIMDMEVEKFIDSRYNPELVGTLMGWGDDSTRLFMRENPMEYDFARTASDLEIKLWIKYRAEQFRKKEGVVPSR